MFKGITKQSFKDTLKMGWPSVIEYFFTAVVTIIDSLMVSGLGKEAVAAVGMTSRPGLIRLIIFTAINIALSSLIARRRGEQKKKDANRILITALLLTLSLSVIITVLCYFYAEPILLYFSSDDTTLKMGATYFKIIMVGTIFTTMQNCINAAQRSAGHTKIAMVTHLVSSTVNVCCNFLLIEGRFGFPRLEIRGAAIATVTGMFVACVISVLSLFKKNTFLSIPYMIAEKCKASAEALRSIFKLGYSIFFEQILLNIGMTVTSLLVAKQGTDALAAHHVGTNVFNISFSFGQGLQAAAVALIGRSIGEKRLDKVKSYANTCRLLGLIIAAILMVLIITGARPLYSLFFPGEENVIQIGVSLSWIAAAIILCQVLEVVNIGCLHGAGDTVFTALVGIIGSAVIRTSVSWLLGVKISWVLAGITGIWLGTLADMSVRLIMTAIRMRSGKWIKTDI